MKKFYLFVLLFSFSFGIMYVKASSIIRTKLNTNLFVKLTINVIPPTALSASNGIIRLNPVTLNGQFPNALSYFSHKFLLHTNAKDPSLENASPESLTVSITNTDFQLTNTTNKQTIPLQMCIQQGGNAPTISCDSSSTLMYFTPTHPIFTYSTANGLKKILTFVSSVPSTGNKTNMIFILSAIAPKGKVFPAGKYIGHFTLTFQLSV